MTDWKGWQGFLDAVAAAESELNFEADEECFYRGHAERSWPLLPSLYRLRLPSAGTKEEAVHRRSLESDLFFEFEARARELHAMALTRWDVLFFMRHHGVPTRLLDWTESLGVALFFALEQYCAERLPCVWLLNPYLLNEYETGERDLFSPKFLGYDEAEDYYYDYDELLVHDGFDWERPIAIYPAQRSARMGAQRGWFTIHGSDPLSLEDLCPEAVRRVDIPKEVVPLAADLLSRMGVDKYLMYQDLDGLSDALKAKYRVWTDGSTSAARDVPVRARKKRERGQRRARQR